MLAPRPAHNSRRSQARDLASTLSGHPDTPSGRPDTPSGPPDAQLPFSRLFETSVGFAAPVGAKLAGMSFGISGIVPSLRYAYVK